MHLFLSPQKAAFHCSKYIVLGRRLVNINMCMKSPYTWPPQGIKLRTGSVVFEVTLWQNLDQFCANKEAWHTLGVNQYNKLDMRNFCEQNSQDCFYTITFSFIWLNFLSVGIVDISGKYATPTSI